MEIEPTARLRSPSLTAPAVLSDAALSSSCVGRCVQTQAPKDRLALCACVEIEADGYYNMIFIKSFQAIPSEIDGFLSIIRETVSHAVTTAAAAAAVVVVVAMVQEDVCEYSLPQLTIVCFVL